jgi:hypothetical protein
MKLIAKCSLKIERIKINNTELHTLDEIIAKNGMQQDLRLRRKENTGAI